MLYDVLVVGGGHAGIEAALASAGMGAKTLLITNSAESIGRMSCNPAIGGIAKGQLVREIDALGGEMGVAADETGIHFRMLNASKGPAVRSPRCQVDMEHYSRRQSRVVRESSCRIVEGMVEDLVFRESKLVGVRLGTGDEFSANKIILATGTFLRGEIHRGKDRIPAGRIDEPPCQQLSTRLQEAGLQSLRMKTGTPSRVRAASIDWDKCEIQHPDPVPTPFSFRHASINRPALPCHATWTTPEAHAVIHDNIDQIPLYNGQISGIGPRYCPSIEDKVYRFADRDRHQIFLEPQGLNTDAVYLNGISSSMSAELQLQFLHRIPGLEHAEVIRYGYAIEYDFFPPRQIFPTMESHVIPGLYFAGQPNGTTGYEEAAAQGLIAGINAVLALRNESPFIPGRNEAYIGVLIDDLVTKDITEPYRMFTSRAEFRLSLRHDNADERLMRYGRKFGLLDERHYAGLLRKLERRDELRHCLGEWKYQGKKITEYLKRPEARLRELVLLDEAPESVRQFPDADLESVETEIKYSGYLEREQKRAEKMREQEDLRLPENIDYSAIREMRREGRDKLARLRPQTMGQARRIDGVSPADLQIIEVYMKRGVWPLIKKEEKTGGS